MRQPATGVLDRDRDLLGAIDLGGGAGLSAKVAVSTARLLAPGVVDSSSSVPLRLMNWFSTETSYATQPSKTELMRRWMLMKHPNVPKEESTRSQAISSSTWSTWCLKGVSVGDLLVGIIASSGEAAARPQWWCRKGCVWKKAKPTAASNTGHAWRVCKTHCKTHCNMHIHCKTHCNMHTHCRGTLRGHGPEEEEEEEEDTDPVQRLGNCTTTGPKA